MLIGSDKAALNGCSLGDDQLVTGLGVAERHGCTLFDYSESRRDNNEPVYTIRNFRVTADDINTKLSGFAARLVNNGYDLILSS